MFKPDYLIKKKKEVKYFRGEWHQKLESLTGNGQ